MYWGWREARSKYRWPEIPERNLEPIQLKKLFCTLQNRTDRVAGNRLNSSYTHLNFTAEEKNWGQFFKILTFVKLAWKRQAVEYCPFLGVKLEKPINITALSFDLSSPYSPPISFLFAPLSCIWWLSSSWTCLMFIVFLNWSLMLSWPCVYILVKGTGWRFLRAQGHSVWEGIYGVLWISASTGCLPDCNFWNSCSGFILKPLAQFCVSSYPVFVPLWGSFVTLRLAMWPVVGCQN